MDEEGKNLTADEEAMRQIASWYGGWSKLTGWTRLGFMIPMAPWPIFLLLGFQGHQGWGRHSVTPLHVVSKEALDIIPVCSLVGVIFLCFGAFRGDKVLLRGLLFLCANLGFLYLYVILAAVAFA